MHEAFRVVQDLGYFVLRRRKAGIWMPSCSVLRILAIESKLESTSDFGAPTQLDTNQRGLNLGRSNSKFAKDRSVSSGDKARRRLTWL